MPLPKLPSKPAALLAPKDYPKAERGKTVKPHIALVEPVAPADLPAVAKAIPQPHAPQAKITGKRPVEKPRATPKAVESRAKSTTSRTADKLGMSKLFVLDTNVLMHDPTSLFRFEEHDIYLPMITLEELDNHK